MLEVSWQDAVLMMGNFVFLAALIPSLVSSDKPSKWTSLVTATTLTAFAVAYYSLSLMYGAIGATLSALAWWVLCIQKW